MKRKVAGIAAIGLSIMMAAVYMPSTTFAASMTNADKAAVDNVKKAVEESANEDIYDYVGDDEAKDADYPAAYDLSDGRVNTHAAELGNAEDVITSVKFQNPYGTCWGFAAIAAAEGSIISEAVKEKGADKDYLRENLDLSEKHLGWFSSGKIEDESDSQYGEGMVWNSSISASAHYDTGGTPQMATSLFSSGVGPVEENRVDVPEGLFEYHGKDKEIEYTKVYDKESGKYKTVPYCYSSEDDWTIDYDYRFYQSYKLEQSFVLPSPAGTENKHYKYNEDGTNAIKDQLTQGRPVCVAFEADSSTPKVNKDGHYINVNTWAHYTYDENTGADHAVTIVGYDDDYSKDNFNEGHQPPADGAFLVKNSWGASENAFPNDGGGWGIEVDGESTGYFWLSYYDKSLCMCEAMDFDLDNEGNTEYTLDQYDYCSEEYPMNNTSKALAKTSNVYTAEETEDIFSVGCQTSAPNTTVTYDIYLLNSKSENPEDGIWIDSEEETYEYGGYHKCNISGVTVQKGQKYSVVVTQQQSNGKYAIFMNSVFSKKYNKAENNTANWGKAVINEGESYIYADGLWVDFKNVATTVEKSEDNLIEIDNFPIKAYARASGVNAQLRMDMESGELAGLGNEDDLGVYFKGDMSDIEDDSIEWKSTNPDVIQISPYYDNDGNLNDAKINIKSVGLGTAYVYAANSNAGIAVCKVTVVKPDSTKITSIKGVKKGFKLNWKAYDFDGYQISCSLKSNMKNAKSVYIDDPETASAKVTGLKSGKKYYVRIRTYSQLDDKTVYSKWSAKKTVKIK